MNDETRVRRAGTFDEIAELYDLGRRECPDQLFKDLFEQTNVSPANARVLEIGCGTGQATLPLVRRGCRVTCVEMGANLARIARRKLATFRNVMIENARFEDWQLYDEPFDIVFAATAWHWIDPRVRYAKAAALRPEGVLAFTTGGHAFPLGFDSFFTEIQPCYKSIGAGTTKWPLRPPDEIPDSRPEIERSGCFHGVRVVRRVWTEEFTADEYVALMRTASDHRLMNPTDRRRLFAEMRRLIEARPSRRILKHNLTILHVARRNT